MKNLIFDLNQEISILDKYGLTPTELLAIRVLLLLQDEGNEELFHNLVNMLKSNNIKLREVLESLQNKEIILKSWKIPASGTKFDQYSIPINKNFIKNLYKSSFEMGKELFESYPVTTVINNSVITLRGVSKHFDSLEECYFKYGKSIGWNPEKHKYILDLVNWSKENNVLHKSLGAFVVDNGWFDLEALKNGDVVNINYDAVKML